MDALRTGPAAEPATKPIPGQTPKPEDLLRAAVAGKAASAADKADGEPRAGGGSPAGKRPSGGWGMAPWPGLDRRALGAAGIALAFGTALGAGLAAAALPSRAPGQALAALGTDLDANRVETGRLGGEVARLQHVLVELKASSEAVRQEAAARGTALGERLGTVETNLGAKLAAVNASVERVGREQAARIAGLAAAERQPATAAAARSDPPQTGSLAEPRGADARGPEKATETRAAEARAPEAKATETKAPERVAARQPDPKAVENRPADAAPDGRAPEGRTSDARKADPRSVEARLVEPKAKPAERGGVIDGWALRDVYDGLAILENRRRHLVEVAPGDTLPGIGRVEAVERRGHDWVVVTRQGLVTAQPW